MAVQCARPGSSPEMWFVDSSVDRGLEVQRSEVQRSEVPDEGGTMGEWMILFGGHVLDVGFSGRLYLERFSNGYWLNPRLDWLRQD